MYVDPFRRPEIAEIMSDGVDKLVLRGVGKRAAVRRIARKHSVNARSVRVMIGRAEEMEGGLA